MSREGVRQRITISATDLTIAPEPGEVSSFAAARFGEHAAELQPRVDDRSAGRRRMEVVVDGWRFEVLLEPAHRAELRERALRAAAEHHVAAEITLRAQIPGRVTRLWVSDGDQVEQGQRLLAIEAMKMENEIRAPQSGTVARIRVEAGARVEREDELLTIA